MIGYLRQLLLLIVVVRPASQQASSRSCPPKNYYDVHMERCYPCSDCDHPRTPNQFCLKDCGEKCEAGKYYDRHTNNCHLCTECKPPQTPNEFCRAQCTDDEINGRTTAPVLPVASLATSGMMPSTGYSVEKIIIIVVCTVMGAIVVVLITLAVLYRRNCPCKHQQDQFPVHGHQREPFIKRDTNNGQHPVTIEMHSLPASRSDNPQQTHLQNYSLPMLTPPHQVGVNNQNNCLHNGDEGSVELVDDRDQTVSHTPSRSSVEPSTRLQYSLSPQDKSLRGNVVCQPENEEQDRCQFLPSVCYDARDPSAVHGMLSPSSTRDAEQPHLSFDPNKNCGFEDRCYQNSDSIPNGFEMQTSLKSSC